MQTHHVMGIESWLAELSEGLPALADTKAGWADSLTSLASQTSSLAALHLSTDEPLTEIALALTVNNVAKGTPLFIGNSMFVRLVDMFARLDGYEVYSNRGASGIDGLIATASGTIRVHNRPSVIFVGDTSLLYDLNSLALLSHQQTPVVLVVTNNDGGAIFDLLPVPEQKKQSLYQMPHGLAFEHAAKQFNLKYVKPETLSDYEQVVASHLESGSGAMLIEIQTPPEQASAQLREFIQQLHAL